jgi:hypothetical protein
MLHARLPKLQDLTRSILFSNLQDLTSQYGSHYHGQQTSKIDGKIKNWEKAFQKMLLKEWEKIIILPEKYKENFNIASEGPLLGTWWPTNNSYRY